jgi:hypothetical protein
MARGWLAVCKFVIAMAVIFHPKQSPSLCWGLD